MLSDEYIRDLQNSAYHNDTHSYNIGYEEGYKQGFEDAMKIYKEQNNLINEEDEIMTQEEMMLRLAANPEEMEANVLMNTLTDEDKVAIEDHMRAIGEIMGATNISLKVVNLGLYRSMYCIEIENGKNY